MFNRKKQKIEQGDIAIIRDKIKKYASKFNATIPILIVRIEAVDNVVVSLLHASKGTFDDYNLKIQDKRKKQEWLEIIKESLDL